MTNIRVWLPERDAIELMGGLPAGMAADVWAGGEQLPDSADEVEVVVLPFGVPPSRMPLLAKLPRLRLIQLMSAGAEHAIPFVPPVSPCATHAVCTTPPWPNGSWPCSWRRCGSCPGS